jgi:hypothetical protein
MNTLSKINNRFAIVTIIILLLAVSRIVPHPYNMTPVGAMALFGGAYFSKRWQAFLIPLVALWLSDLVLNNVIYKHLFTSTTFFYEGFYFVYFGFALITLLGFTLLKKVSVWRVIGTSLLGSILFFIVTNFGAWYGSSFYPQNMAGLTASYVAGLEFFRNSILGDLIWSGVLFGGFEWARRQFPALSLQR